MLCEVIAYILSRQRLSAKTFVAGYFFMLCRIDCLCGCCATPPVSEASLSTSPRVHPSGITRGYAWCVPSGDSGCGLGGFFFLSTLHFSTSPRVRPSGITRGYAWCVPSGDSGWTMSYFFSYQEKQTLERNVFSHSCGLICRAQKYNKGVS